MTQNQYILVAIVWLISAPVTLGILWQWFGEIKVLDLIVALVGGLPVAFIMALMNLPNLNFVIWSKFKK